MNEVAKEYFKHNAKSGNSDFRELQHSNGKSFSDLDYVVLMGAKLIKEKEEHERNNPQRAFTTNMFSGEHRNLMVDFCINVAEAKKSGEFSDKVLEDHIRESLYIK